MLEILLRKLVILKWQLKKVEPIKVYFDEIQSRIKLKSEKITAPGIVIITS